MSRRHFLTLAAAAPAATALAWLHEATPASAVPANPSSPSPAVRKNILTSGVSDAFVRAVKALKTEPSTTGLPSRYDEFVRAHHDVIADRKVHRHPAFLPWHRAFLMDFEKECQRVLGDPGFGLPYWDWTADSAEPGAGGVWSAQILGGAGSPVATGPFSGATDWPVYSPNGNPKTELYRALADPGFGDFPTGAKVHALYLNATYESFWLALEGGFHDYVHVWVGGNEGQMSSVSNSVSDPAFWLHHCNVDRIWAQWQRVYPNESLSAVGFPDFSATAVMPPTRVGGTGTTAGAVLDASTTTYLYDKYYQMQTPLTFKIWTTSSWTSFTGTDDDVSVMLWLRRPGETSDLSLWSRMLDKEHCDHRNPFENGKVDTFRYPDLVFGAWEGADLTGLQTPVCVRRMALRKVVPDNGEGDPGDDWKLGKFEIHGDGWAITSDVLDIWLDDRHQRREFDLAAPKF